MATQSRIVTILELMASEGPTLTPEQLMQRLRVSRATVFRDLQPLVRSGLIQRIGTHGYTLGPRIVELDRQIRIHDPLLVAAGELPSDLVRRTGGSVLICRRHGHSVMCIQEYAGHLARHPLSYQRGRAMPLYRGATSKIVLANLKAAEIEELIRDDPAGLAAAGLGQTAADIRQQLKAWHEAGHVITHSDVDADMTGMAVPILLGQQLLGSLSLVLPTANAPLVTQQRAITLLKSTSRRIEARLMHDAT